MLKKYANKLNCDCERRVRHAVVDMNGARCLSPHALVVPSGCIEYCHVFIVLCDSLQEVFNIINIIFVRLHKAISRLICWDDESVHLEKPLPDILKDLNIRKMHQMNLQPDIISNSPRKETSHCNRRSPSEIEISVPSRRDHSTHSHLNYTYVRFHQLSHINSNACLHDNNMGENDNISKRHQLNYNIRDSRRIYVSDLRSASAPVTNERDRGRLSYTQKSISHERFDVNQSQCPRQTSSKSIPSRQRNHSVSEPPNHRQALTYQRSRHYHRADCHGMSRDEIDNRSGYAVGGVDVETQQMSEQCDPEILKDIVQTLRNVGDDLDTKMRNYNEPFHQAVMDALKTNTGQLLLATVKQFNLVGVAIEASLSLLKLLNQ